MLEHEIKNKVLTIGNRKGQTVYYAYPKSQQKLTNNKVVERIVRETSLSEGDVKNDLVRLSNIVCDALKMGMSVDLVELGSIRIVVPSKMMDTPEEVTVKDALKTPKIVFTPKQKMRDAANSVELSIDRSTAKRIVLRQQQRRRRRHFRLSRASGAVAPLGGCSQRVLIE